MTNIRWPLELPQIMRLEALKAQRQSSVVRTETDAGPSKQRQRYTVATKFFSGTIIVNEQQRRILENWYINSLANGTLRFVMKDPQTLEDKEFRFTQDYSEDSNDGLWTIGLSLEKMNA